MTPSLEADWKTERASLLRDAKTIIIKVGSAVITTENGLNQEVMEHLAAQMVFLWEQHPKRNLVLVTSGAVAAGRRLLQDQQMHESLSVKQAVAAVGQSKLMHAWDQAFLAHKRITAQVLLTREDLRIRQHFLNIRNTFAELLSWRVLPIVNENDTVSVQELKFGDNDKLSSLLANVVDADLCINLTSAQGVFAKDPQKELNVHPLTHITDIATRNLEEMCGSKTNVGTGGMFSKLRAARRTAQIGIPTLILPGRKPHILEQALSPTSTLGTWISPSKEKLSRRKYWLAYQSEPEGEVFIDEGASLALLQHGKSLLPGGITQVSGSFQKGALVRILRNDPMGTTELGVGLTNYSAQELTKIKGLKRHEVAALLGNAHYPEVIHRDNLVLHAVL